jgi:hypothetical protein
MNEPTMDKVQQLVTAVLEAVDARLDGIRHELVQFAADADQRHHDVLGMVADLDRRVDELASRPAPVATPAEPRQSVADLNERMAQATKILVERMEAAHHEATMATDRKVAQLAEQLEAVRAMATATLAHASPSVPAPRAAGATPTHAAVTSPVAAEMTTTAPAVVEVHEAAHEAAHEAVHEHTPAPAMSGSFGPVTGQLPHLNVDALAEISRPLFGNGHVTGSTPPVTDSARVQQVTAPPIPPIVAPTMAPTGVPPAHAAHEDIDIARLTSLISEKLDHLSLPNRPE